MEGESLLSFSVQVNEAPDVHGFPEREREQPMGEKVLWFLRGFFAIRKVCGTRHQLVPVSQNLTSHKRRVFELWVDSERQIDTLRDVIDNPVGNEDLHADVRIGCLESADEGSKERVRNAGRRSEP